MTLIFFKSYNFNLQTFKYILPFVNKKNILLLAKAPLIRSLAPQDGSSN
jgi:hypothetical protein